MDVNNLYAGHRSHRSHSSSLALQRHRSHYSGYGFYLDLFRPLSLCLRGAYGSSVTTACRYAKACQAPLEVTSPARRFDIAAYSAMMDLVTRVELALFTKGEDVRY